MEKKIYEVEKWRDDKLEEQEKQPLSEMPKLTVSLIKSKVRGQRFYCHKTSLKIVKTVISKMGSTTTNSSLAILHYLVKIQGPLFRLLVLPMLARQQPLWHPLYVVVLPI